MLRVEPVIVSIEYNTEGIDMCYTFYTPARLIIDTL